MVPTPQPFKVVTLFFPVLIAVPVPDVSTAPPPVIPSPSSPTAVTAFPRSDLFLIASNFKHFRDRSGRPLQKKQSPESRKQPSQHLACQPHPRVPGQHNAYANSFSRPRPRLDPCTARPEATPKRPAVLRPVHPFSCFSPSRCFLQPHSILEPSLHISRRPAFTVHPPRCTFNFRCIHRQLHLTRPDSYAYDPEPNQLTLGAITRNRNLRLCPGLSARRQIRRETDKVRGNLVPTSRQHREPEPDADEKNVLDNRLATLRAVYPQTRIDRMACLW